jgi:hypothetical protein
MLLEKLEMDVSAPKGKTSVENEALTLLQAVLKDFLKPNYTHEKDLETNVMTMSHAFELLNWEVQNDAISRELQGYSYENLPEWRKMVARITYESGISGYIPSDLQPHTGIQPMIDSISSVLRMRKDWAILGHVTYTRLVTRKTKSGSNIQAKEVTTVYSNELEKILDSIRQVFYKVCSNSISQLKYGRILESIFEQYQEAVDSKLGQLGISNQLEAAIHDISRDNSESWRNAVMGCRNILTDLANKLWQAPDDYYTPLNIQLKGLPLEPVKNKLRAWIHEKGIGHTENKFVQVQLIKLADVINELYALDSKAKEQIEYQDALCCLINTYTLLGEIALRTDMQPITRVDRNTK